MSQTSSNARSIRVMVADDSAFMRTALTRMIQSDAALDVVGTAQNGLDALEKIPALQPDVITLDIEMPQLNGLETLKRIMRDYPRPVIMISSLTQHGAETTFEALDAGAFDYIPKQLSYASLDIVKIRDDLVAKIKAAAGSRIPHPPCRAAVPEQVAAAPRVRVAPNIIPAVVSIGTSTGGPKALQEILPKLPPDLPVGVLIVQHMPVGFTGPFARRLSNLCRIKVREASPDELVEPGVVYIAPAGSHMTVVRRSQAKVAIQIAKTPENTLHTPSVDVMMLSVAEVYRALSMGVIMTGMGADGALGMKAISNEGGFTLGQDEATCTVYGMPRSCAQMGTLRRVVPLNKIPEQIMQVTGYRSRS